MLFNAFMQKPVRSLYSLLLFTIIYLLGKQNRCSCGNLIVHVRQNEDGRALSPRHQTVFNRLYRHRLTKELHYRKLAAKQIEKEARECTYIPITNRGLQEVKSTSSLSIIAHRERTIEMARERFNQGNMCVECLKKIELSTGTFLLDDEVSSKWHSNGRYHFMDISCESSLTIHVLHDFSFSLINVFQPRSHCRSIQQISEWDQKTCPRTRLNSLSLPKMKRKGCLQVFVLLPE